LLISYTIYAFFFAQNIDSIGNALLLGMSLFSLITLYYSRTSWPFLKSGINVFTIIFGLALITTIIPLWTHGHSDWAFSSACKFVLCLFIVSNFATPESQKHNLFQKTTFGSCIGLSLLMIVQNSGFEIKEILSSSGIHTVNSDWNEKYHAFWLMFLAWIAISNTWKNDTRSKLLTTQLLIYASIAIFSSHSQSSQFALILAIIIFFISKFSMKGIWKFGVIAFIAYILLFPVLWQLFPFSQFEWIPERLYIRFLLFETASNGILDQWFCGHGFGSTLTLPIAPYLPESTSPTDNTLASLANGYNGLFPGAHPHNLIALIWLDFGLIGAMLFTFFIYRFYRWLLPIMNDRDIAPFIIALIVSAVVIFSFSFSIWQTDVVLTYAMFFACLMSVLSKNHKLLWPST